LHHLSALDLNELLMTARAAAVYILILAVLRITGKRTIGNFTAFDLDKILEGEPTLTVKNGVFQRDGLRHERMSDQDVLAALRLAGIDDITEVRMAFVETDGEVSVIRRIPAICRKARRSALMEIHAIAIRTAVSFVFLLALLRLSGKRTLAQACALDFVVVLILGDLVDIGFICNGEPVAHVLRAGGST
jgi:uncharacterized membrane protein YcaP (DUF421 family)